LAGKKPRRKEQPVSDSVSVSRREHDVERKEKHCEKISTSPNPVFWAPGPDRSTKASPFQTGVFNSPVQYRSGDKHRRGTGVEGVEDR
jgi:hypothetical protein